MIVSRTGTLWFYVLYSDVISVLSKHFLSNKMLHLLLLTTETMSTSVFQCGNVHRFMETHFYHEKKDRL